MDCVCVCVCHMPSESTLKVTHGFDATEQSDLPDKHRLHMCAIVTRAAR